MTIRTSWYTMNNKLGVNLDNVVTSVTLTNNPTQPEYPGPPHNLGDRVHGNNGSEWMLVQAGATVSAFNFLAIGGQSFSAQNITTALWVSGIYTFGIAQFQPRGGVTSGNASGGVANTGDFFWALIKANGGARVNITASATMTPGAALYISGSQAGYITASAGISASLGGSRANGMQYIGTVSIDAASATTPIAAEVAMFSYVMPGALVSVQGITTTA